MPTDLQRKFPNNHTIGHLYLLNLNLKLKFSLEVRQDLNFPEKIVLQIFVVTFLTLCLISFILKNLLI